MTLKVAIIGAGAIGGYVGVKLALAGGDVSFIARGANLEAIRRHGMRLQLHDGSEQLARQVDGAGAPDTDTQEDRQQFGIGERAGAEFQKPLARALAFGPVGDRHRWFNPSRIAESE